MFMADGWEINIRRESLVVVQQHHFRDTVFHRETPQIIKTSENRASEDIASQVAASVGVDEAGALDLLFAQKTQSEFCAPRCPQDKDSALRPVSAPRAQRFSKEERGSSDRHKQKPCDDCVDHEYRAGETCEPVNCRETQHRKRFRDERGCGQTIKVA